MNEKSIRQIQEEYKDTSDDRLDAFIREYIKDGRPGVAKLINQAQRKIMKLQEEKARVFKMTEFEQKYFDYEYICGIDEVGRGPLAGPTVAGAVILPKDLLIYYINDSKKLSETKREKLYDEICDKALAYAVGIVDVDSINATDNISQSVFEAMRQAVDKLDIRPDVLFVDAVHIPDIDIKQVSIIKGDAKSLKMTIPQQSLEPITLIGDETAINAISAAALSLEIDLGESPKAGTMQYTAHLKINGYDDVWAYYGDDSEGIKVYITLA